MAKGKDIFRSLDSFGLAFQFKIKGAGTLTTYPGAVLTLFYLSLLLAYGGYQLMLMFTYSLTAHNQFMISGTYNMYDKFTQQFDNAEDIGFNIAIGVIDYKTF
jgi:hypothetical protein